MADDPDLSNPHLQEMSNHMSNIQTHLDKAMETMKMMQRKPADDSSSAGGASGSAGGAKNSAAVQTLFYKAPTGR